MMLVFSIMQLLKFPKDISGLKSCALSMFINKDSSALESESTLLWVYFVFGSFKYPLSLVCTCIWNIWGMEGQCIFILRTFFSSIQTRWTFENSLQSWISWKPKYVIYYLIFNFQDCRFCVLSKPLPVYIRSFELDCQARSKLTQHKFSQLHLPMSLYHIKRCGE